MTKYFSMIAFLTITCFSFTCFASHKFEVDTGCCIKEMVGNKVYLKPTTVHIAKNGIFINIDGGLYAVSHLETDVNGVYIDTNRAEANFLVDDCPQCGDSRILGICTNSQCPSKQKN